MSLGALAGMVVSRAVLVLLVACRTMVVDPVGFYIGAGPALLTRGRSVFNEDRSRTDFGDGGGSTTCDQPETTHTYLTAGMFQACLEFGLREDPQVRDRGAWGSKCPDALDGHWMTSGLSRRGPE